MPPKETLSAKAVEDLEAWIRRGAPMPKGAATSPAGADFWAFPAAPRHAGGVDRLPPAREAEGEGAGDVAPRRPADAPAPDRLRPDGPAAGKPGGGRRRGDRTAAGVDGLRRALGAALAGPGALRGDARLRIQQGPAERVAVPRLADPGLQRGPAVRPLRPGADRGRRPGRARRDDGRRLPRLRGLGRGGPQAAERGDARAGPRGGARGHHRHGRSDLPGPDRELRALPQPQVRADPAGGVLPLEERLRGRGLRRAPAAGPAGRGDRARARGAQGPALADRPLGLRGRRARRPGLPARRAARRREGRRRAAAARRPGRAREDAGDPQGPGREDPRGPPGAAHARAGRRRGDLGRGGRGVRLPRVRRAPAREVDGRQRVLPPHARRRRPRRGRGGRPARPPRGGLPHGRHDRPVPERPALRGALPEERDARRVPRPRSPRALRPAPQRRRQGLPRGRDRGRRPLRPRARPRRDPRLLRGPRPDPEAEARRRVLADELAKLRQGKPSTAWVGTRTQPDAPTKRLLRGDVEKPAEVVAPGGLEALGQGAFGIAPDAPEAERRVRFAAWISTSPQAARTIVNRVWHLHFGRGLVATTNDLGPTGELPSHPELLDWLASRFLEDGMSLKKLHRRILASDAYRQGSRADAAAMAVDADNKWLWRWAPRRLEAEAIRDALLAAAGRLAPDPGGASFKPFDVQSQSGTTYFALKDAPEFDRRSVYRFNAISGKDVLLDAFDAPDPGLRASERRATSTPLQALVLLNDPFVRRMAATLAERVKGDVALAYRVTLGREPTAEEAERAAATAKEHGMSTVAWALFNSAEFLHVR